MPARLRPLEPGQGITGNQTSLECPSGRRLEALHGQLHGAGRQRTAAKGAASGGAERLDELGGPGCVELIHARATDMGLEPSVGDVLVHAESARPDPLVRLRCQPIGEQLLHGHLAVRPVSVLVDQGQDRVNILLCRPLGPETTLCVLYALARSRVDGRPVGGEGVASLTDGRNLS